jgi:hypothetical protein
MEKQTEYNWRWIEGRVSPSDDHFKIMYGRDRRPVALVARGQGDCFNVQFAEEVKNDKNGCNQVIEKVKEEIDLILVKKKKSDPWAYALLRCCANNQHSDIQWGYFPKK